MAAPRLRSGAYGIDPQARGFFCQHLEINRSCNRAGHAIHKLSTNGHSVSIQRATLIKPV